MKILVSSFLGQFNPNKDPSSSTVAKTWSRLLRSRHDVKNSIHRKPFVLATLYMLHIESRLSVPDMRVDSERREALKRFAKWVPCQCDENCEREWNFANDLGLWRGDRSRVCKVARLFEQNTWQSFLGKRYLDRLEETRRLWQASSVQSGR